MKITEQDMHRPVKETHQEEKYNIYGGAESKVEIEALSERGTSVGPLATKIPKGVVVIDGIYVYTVIKKPSTSVDARTDAYR